VKEIAMIRTMLFAASVLLGVSGGAWAQVTGNPAGLSPSTPGVEAGSPASGHSNNQDQLFVRQALIGNRAEADLGKLAAGKATDPAVKEYAQRMTKEHNASGERLAKAGRSIRPEGSKDVDAEHKRIKDELSKKSGAVFDMDYLASQIEDHQRTANLLLWHLSYGQNADLIKYSSETLPVVLDHLQQAKDTYARLAAGSANKGAQGR
jgi:putative membrane protein